MVQKSVRDASRMTRRTLVVVSRARVRKIALNPQHGIEEAEAKENVGKEVKIVHLADRG
jgi:hypothetical protein